MTINQHITFLYVSDLDRASTLYGDVLGLDLVLDQGGCRIFRVAGDAFLGICDTRPERIGADGALVTFVTDDVDGIFSRLVEFGVEIVSPPRHNQEYEIYNFFASDGDGNLFEVQRFDDPTWDVAEP